MNNKEVVKQTKKTKIIKENPQGAWVATMDSESFEWKAVGRTEDEAINAIVKEWNKDARRYKMTREELEDYYGIECEFMKYGKCEWRQVMHKNILKLDSGLYSGTNENGKSVIIQRQKGVGYVISTLQDNGWYEVNEYNEEGILESTTYEKA